MDKCWFCKTAEASPAAVVIVPMYGKVRRGEESNYLVAKTRSIQYEKCEVRIPRCESCKSREVRKYGIVLLSYVCGLVAAYFAVFEWYGMSGWPGYLLVAVTGALIGFVIVYIMGMFTTPVDSAQNFYGSYPGITEKMAQHWTVGDGPPGGIKF